MHLSPQERLRSRSLVLGHHRDWAALQAVLKAKNLAISQSSLDRFFSGKSKSPRTFRTLAILLGTTPESLESQIRILARAARRPSCDEPAPDQLRWRARNHDRASERRGKKAPAIQSKKDRRREAGLAFVPDLGVEYEIHATYSENR